MGCTLFQGYLFSVPLAVKDFERYLARRNAAAAAEGHGNRAEQPESAEQTESAEQVAEGEGRGAA